MIFHAAGLVATQKHVPLTTRQQVNPALPCSACPPSRLPASTPPMKTMLFRWSQELGVMFFRSFLEDPSRVSCSGTNEEKTRRSMTPVITRNLTVIITIIVIKPLFSNCSHKLRGKGHHDCMMLFLDIDARGGPVNVPRSMAQICTYNPLAARCATRMQTGRDPGHSPSESRDLSDRHQTARGPIALL